MNFGVGTKAAVAAVAVMALSVATMFLYVVSTGGVSLFEPLSRRMIEGALLATLLVGAMVFLLTRGISRQAELRKVQEKDETLTAILDNLKEGVLATNLDGQIMFANRTARSIMGLEGAAEDPGDVQKLPNPWEDFDLQKAVIRCAEKHECGEARVQGSESLLRVNLEHMPAFDEHKGGVLVVIQDLSEGRRLEATQHRFLTNAAHELRTPLSNIIFAAEFLTSGAAADVDTRRRFLNHVLSGARRMQQLSEALLKLARVGWDGREPNIESTAPEKAAYAAVESMRPLAESADVTLNCRGDATTVLADPALLEQALLTLISNAIKHSTKGDQVTVRLDGAEILVEDRGSGISEAELPHVFERFYRNGGNSGGFGLGLSICKEIVESMDGEISIHSEGSMGTTARIKLPEAAAE